MTFIVNAMVDNCSTTKLVLDFQNISETLQQIELLFKNDTLREQIRKFVHCLNKTMDKFNMDLTIKHDPVPHCPECDKKFKINSEMIKHYRMKHGQSKISKEPGESHVVDQESFEKYEQSVATIKFNFNTSSLNHEVLSSESDDSDDDELPDIAQDSQDIQDTGEETMNEDVEFTLEDYYEHLTNIKKDKEDIHNNKEEIANDNAKFTLDDDGYYKCQLCFKQFSSKKSIDNHLKYTFHNDNDNTCPQCGQHFIQGASLLKHIENNCYKDKKEKRICKECGKVFGCDSFLTRHLRTHMEYVCEGCKKVFRGGKHGLKMHRCSAEKLDLPCEQCGKIFHKNGLLMNHIRNVHRQDYLICSDCDYKTKFPSNMATHKNNKHLGKGIKYSCTECDYQTNIKDGFNRHVEAKHSGNKYNCDQCTYTGTSSSLYQHKNLKHKKGKV